MGDEAAWTREDVLFLESQFVQRIPNVHRVVLIPPDISDDAPETFSGVLWIIQGRVTYGVRVIFN